MLVATENIVKRPFKIRVEIRTRDRVMFTVTLVSRFSRALRPVVDALAHRSIHPYSEYIDRYGFVRVVYKNLTWNQVQIIRAMARKYIAYEAPVLATKKKQAVANAL